MGDFAFLEQALAFRPHKTGRWTTEEHDRFVEGFYDYGTVWRDIAFVVGSRDFVQCRTHHQKWVQKEEQRISELASVSRKRKRDDQISERFVNEWENQPLPYHENQVELIEDVQDIFEPHSYVTPSDFGIVHYCDELDSVPVMNLQERQEPRASAVSVLPHRALDSLHRMFVNEKSVKESEDCPLLIESVFLGKHE